MRILAGMFVLVLGLGMAGVSAQAPARISEADYDALMKKVGPANGAMRMKLMSGMLKEAAADAQALATMFGDVERFWAQHKKEDAVKWAADARTNASEVAGAATAGDGMKAQTAANNILASCKQCHGTYREGDATAGFKIKAGTIAD
jgi:cytochrome c556